MRAMGDLLAKGVALYTMRAAHRTISLALHE
jgi:hypothetical protein